MTITRLASAAALGLALTGTAFAADLPMRSAPPPFVAPLPVFTWTGFYLGANAGYMFDTSTHFGVFNAANGAGDRRVLNDDGFTVGGQMGYNYQFGAGNGIVVGLEADAAYTDLNKVGVVAPGVLPLGGPVTSYRGSMDFLGTVRGRVGYAFNQFLVYGTGGFAYGDVTDNVNSFGPGLVGRAKASYSDIATGYTYGGGIEYALPTTSFLNFFHSSAVTLKAEYLHYDLGTETVALNPTTRVRFRNDGDLIRAGINYKF